MQRSALRLLRTHGSDVMKRKKLLICMAAVILQMCFFTGCSKDNSDETSVEIC